MKAIFVFISLFVFTHIYSQTDTASIPPQHIFGAYIRSGQTVVHTVAVENIRGAKPLVIELEASKRRIDFNSWNKSGCFATTGFLLSYFYFDSKVLGTGAALSYFIRPSYRIGNRLTAYYEAGIGADYLTKPYDEIKNPTNRNYSIHVNPYMHIGVGITYQPAPHFIISASGVFHHTSNGEIMQPNKGINWETAGIGLLYTPSDNYLPKYKRNHKIHYTSRRLAIDAGIFFTPKQGYYVQRQSQRTFIGGAMLQFTKPISNTNAITGGISGYYSHYSIKGPNPTINKTDPTLVGIQAGHAFLLGKITFSQQIGFYLVNPTSFIRNGYQQYNLSYLFTKHVHAGVGLRASVDNADFTDVKLMYRF